MDAPTSSRLTAPRWVTFGLGAGLGLGSVALLTIAQLRGRALGRDIQAYNSQVAAAQVAGHDPALTAQMLAATSAGLHEREESLQTLDTATWACGIGAVALLATGGILLWADRRQSAAREPEIGLGWWPAGVELVGKF